MNFNTIASLMLASKLPHYRKLFAAFGSLFNEQQADGEETRVPLLKVQTVFQTVLSFIRFAKVALPKVVPVLDVTRDVYKGEGRV